MAGNEGGSGRAAAEAPLLRPRGAKALLLFAHGAGAGVHHPFMETTARDLADRDVATMRYPFPYMAQGRRRPDPQPVLIESVRAAHASARSQCPDLPLFAGGKSMGGRMTSRAIAERPLPGVQGIIFLGFPLHRPDDESDARAEHLRSVDLPMLFVQGTRDRLAAIDRIGRVCEELGSRATLHVVEGADHGFAVLKRSGRTAEEVRSGIAAAVAEWIAARLTIGPVQK
jgi:predicted alpha/beta-hydrolase family hydrolase